VGNSPLLENGHKVYPKQCVALTVVIDGIKVEIKPVVFEINGFDLLLGNDALRQLRSIQIDFQNPERTMIVGGIDLVVTEMPTDKEGRVRSRESISIPRKN
jgi:hypothetical protein